MNFLLRSGAWVMRAAGWRRAGFAFACGAVSALGFAPLEFFPVLLLGFALLLLLLDGADNSAHPLRAAFIAGWAFAFGQFLTGWHWIGYAFLVDPSAHLWQMPFALIFLSAGLALYAGSAAALALYFWQDGAARLLVFAVLYAAGEWVRGHVFTGFPWNLQGYGWGASLAILQCMAVIGAYGLSFLTILLGASLAEFARPRLEMALESAGGDAGAVRAALGRRRGAAGGKSHHHGAGRGPAHCAARHSPARKRPAGFLSAQLAAPAGSQRRARQSQPSLSGRKRRRRLFCSIARPRRWTRSA